MQEQVAKSDREQISRQQQYESMKQERTELFEKCLTSEQALSDSKRDSELKDIKIESLQNIIAKREQAMNQGGP